MSVSTAEREQRFLDEHDSVLSEEVSRGAEFPHERKVLDALFKSGSSVMLSELKNKFYTQVQPIYKDMYKELVDQQLFPRSPASMRAGSNTALPSCSAAQVHRCRAYFPA